MTLKKKKYPISDHYNGKAFHNLENKVSKNFFKIIYWLWTRKKTLWPKWVENIYAPKLPQNLQAHETAVTFINHSTFLIQTSTNMNVLTDPIWSKRTSPFHGLGPKRVRKPGLNFKDLPHIHLVLISHNHYDHLDLPTLKKLEKKFQPIKLN